MSKIISSIDDIYKIRYLYDHYSSVTVNTSSLKYEGVFSYAIKYAFWALKLDGELIIKDSPSMNDGLSHRHIDFWQIKYVLFKSLKNTIQVINIDTKMGIIKLKKVLDPYTNNGFSFGIVFSGLDQEISQLTKTINSILQTMQNQNYSYEIVICGPTSFDHTKYFQQFDRYPLKYHPLDFDTQNPRIMISKKKNDLFNVCKYNIVSISHTRIIFDKNFASLLYNRKFDACIPKISVNYEGQVVKYLDFSLIGTYDLSRQGTVPSLSGTLLGDDVLYYLKKRVPYMDGGLNIFNKKIISHAPYNPYIAWGEAEDIAMSHKLFTEGFLIDYVEDISCISSTIKIIINRSLKTRIKEAVKHYLTKKGLY